MAKIRIIRTPVPRWMLMLGGILSFVCLTALLVGGLFSPQAGGKEPLNGSIYRWILDVVLFAVIMSIFFAMRITDDCRRTLEARIEKLEDDLAAIRQS